MLKYCLASVAVSSGGVKVVMSPSMTSKPVWSLRTQGAWLARTIKTMRSSRRLFGSSNASSPRL